MAGTSIFALRLAAARDGFSASIAGRTRDAGLGSYPAVGLVAARELAQRQRQLVAAGADPIEIRQNDREARLLASSKATTFKDCANAFVASHEAGWRNDKHRAQWQSTLLTYCYPLIGSLPVASVDTSSVLRVLEPIWKEKPETASRVRQRIERVLGWAKVRGYRDGENPAQWRGHLDHLLPPKQKVRRVRHHAALPFRKIGPLLAKLQEQDSVSAFALRFAILTAARTGEVLGANWDEIDIEKRVWTVTAERMKGQREHRVPLSDAAVSLLHEVSEIRHSEFVFPGAKQG
jgi:integrase